VHSLLIAALASLALAGGTAAQQQPSVTLERVADKRWRATFQFDKPRQSIRFERPASFFRERVWQSVTPGYHLTRQGDSQYAQLDSGASPKREIAFEFPEFTDPLPKEYELFQPFTDGAVAVYTGHFHAVAFGTQPADSVRVSNIRVVLPANTHGIVQGAVRTKGPVTFSDSGEGTYVYIGTAKPIETQDIIAVVDPGMPAWLRRDFDRNLPLLFHEYATRLGAPLPTKPVVYFSFDEKGSGRSSGGGVLTGLVNMTLSGNDWRTETPEGAEQAFALVAHESAHLWNGQLVANASDGTASWMHEGSADALANEMLLAAGVIDTARYRARRNDALNRCIAANVTGSVETALRRGAVREVYDCGFIVGTWTAALARRNDPNATLFTFWRALIAAARPRGTYTDSLYFRTLSSMGAADTTIAHMRSFLASKDSANVLMAGLRSAGSPARAGQGDPPQQFQQDLVRGAMIHLMQQACSRLNFSSGAPIRTGAIPGCAPFAAAMQVHAIAGQRVRDQGAALYDAVRAACAVNEGVPLQDEAGKTLVVVPCTKPLAARAAWYEIGR
jgi:hypothetical protein